MMFTVVNMIIFPPGLKGPIDIRVIDSIRTLN